MRERDYVRSVPPNRLQQKVLEFFSRQKSTTKIDDVRFVSTYQDKHIDALWWFKDRHGTIAHKSLEVRISHAIHPVLYVETVANINRRTKGALFKTHADHWCVFFDMLQCLLIVPVKNLRTLVETHSYRRISVPVSRYQGVVGERAEGVLVPIEDIVEEISDVVLVRRFG